MAKDITKMTAKEKLALLEGCAICWRNAVELEEAMEEQRAKVERCTASLTTCSGGALPQDRMLEYLAIWEKAFDKWKAQIRGYEEHASACEEIIRSLPEKYQVVVRLRYVRGLKLRDVAAQMNYSYGWAKTLSAEAIALL